MEPSEFKLKFYVECIQYDNAEFKKNNPECICGTCLIVSHFVCEAIGHKGTVIFNVLVPAL